MNHTRVLWFGNNHKMKSTNMTFGAYAKDRRIAAGLTLRCFCREARIDPSNWSKIERGVLPPPDEASFLTRVANALGLSGDDPTELADLAAIARGEIPADLQSQDVLSKMPAFFRAIRGQEYTPEDFEKLLSGVKRLHEP